MSAHARELVERGYAVFEGFADPAAVEALRAAIEELVVEIDPPRFYASPTEVLSDDVVVTSPGLAISRLLHARPALRPLVLRPELATTMRATLGDDAVLELAGAVVSDATRPFFRWHTHIDGEDEGERVKRGAWPAIADPLRVLTLLYLQDLDDDVGPLYVFPRRVGDPTPPPHDLDAHDWPGMVELRPRAGTLVALEQCTWHAADSLRGPGHRIFVGCYFAAARAERPDWADAELSRGPLL
ncbi:MAG: phytanoyl-CoA dioxygenase family protein [Sandaracinaceae bacterium]|nr:phytanoyl-CoA dioxygenase family protein [Sandaracinaceae bacterium]